LKQLAIVGPTASGKSDAALTIAQDIDAYILSIDSLSIYKEVNIASAKPSQYELSLIKHYGINELYINEHCNVNVFIDLYKKIKADCIRDNKNLIIVGGSSFYLKSMITGLSILPKYSQETLDKADDMLKDLDSVYELLKGIDNSLHVEPNDRYRLEKNLLIYLQSAQSPSEWFKAHPPSPIIDNIDIYNIDIDRVLLRERVTLRTQKMLENHLIEEIEFLESKYGREPNAMKAIGVIEVLEYFDGMHSKDKMIELIITHTMQLAKRQRTFNKNQFKDAKTFASKDALLEHFLKVVV
jgi:tRNA dimethylallyltransferase